MDAPSTTDSPHNTTVQWEWWMLLVLGYVGTAVVVAICMGILCLVWHCCPCRTINRSRDPSVREKEESCVASQRDLDTPSAVPPRRLSFHSEANLESALSSSHVGCYSPRFGSMRTDSNVDVPRGGESPTPDAKHSPSPLLPDVLADAAAGPAASHVSPAAQGLEGGGISPVALMHARRSDAPEDVFVAVTSGESPGKRMRRHKSIASHMEVGLSHDESLRLHLMRHADTSDPTFGTFVKSSRSRH